jgi:hypothetical protein
VDVDLVNQDLDLTPNLALSVGAMGAAVGMGTYAAEEVVFQSKLAVQGLDSDFWGSGTLCLQEITSTHPLCFSPCLSRARQHT